MAPTSVRSVDVATITSFGAATNNSSSIGELVGTIPQMWRPSLGKHLNDIYRAATKLCSVQNTIAQYERHSDAKTFPGSIASALREPKIQFSKEFLATEEGRLADGTLQEGTRQSRLSALEKATTLKKQELACLQKTTAWNPDRWSAILTDVAERVAQTINVTIDTKNVGKLSWPAGTPEHIIGEWKLLDKHGSTYHYRVLTLARSIADRTLVQKTKNLSLKTQTDTEMKDVDTEKSTREVVKEEMQAQLRLLDQRLAKAIGQVKKPVPKKRVNKPSGVKKAGPKKGPQGKKKKNGR